MTKKDTGMRRHGIRVGIAAATIAAVGLTTVPATALASGEDAMPGAAPVVETAELSVEEAIAQLRASGLWNEGTGAELRAETASVGLAGRFGTVLFNGVVSKGVSMGTDELLRQLGFDPNSETKEALDEIRRSLDQLNAEVQRISDQLEQVLDGQDRTNFYNSYTEAGIAATRLSIASASVSGWQASGARPSEADVAAMRTVVLQSVSDLTFVATNTVTGTIPLMMKAVQPSDVADLDGYWEDIDVVRGDYRAVLAQGLVALDLLTRFDATGTVRSDLDTLTPIATAAVGAMYDFGVRADGPDQRPFVQLRGSPYAISGWGSIPAEDRDTWYQTTDPNHDAQHALRRDVVEPVLVGMAQRYRPDLHGGASLEQYLQARGIPTKVVYTDTFHTRTEETGGGLTKYYHLYTRVVAGEIVGNSYHVRDIDIDRNYEAYRRVWNLGCWCMRTDQGQKAAADAWAAERRDHWRTASSTMAVDWVYRRAHDATKLGDYSGRMVIGEPTNSVVGFHADLDPDRIWDAAFGLDP